MSDNVVIAGESLSAAQRPPSVSRLVKGESDRLLGQLELPLLVSSFDSVGSNLRDAYVRVSPFNDLQTAVQRASYTLTRLGDRAAASLDTFRHAANKVLDDLECVYSLLVDGLDDVALATLGATNHGSAKLAGDARSLADEFETAASEVQRTLELTLARRAAQERRRKELARQVEEYRILLTQAQNSKVASDESFDEADRLYQSTLQRESIAVMKSNALHMAQVAAIAGALFSTRTSLNVLGIGGVSALSSAFEAEVIRVREEKAVHLHARQKSRLSKLELAKEVAELQCRIRLASEEDEIAEAAVKSLEDAVAGLRCLSGVMLKAEVFWNQVETHCGRSDAAALHSIVETSKTLPPARRAELWKSDAFKQRAVRVYAPWVALQDICTQFMELMKGTRSTLYHLLEHPSASSDDIAHIAVSSLDICEIESFTDDTRLVHADRSQLDCTSTCPGHPSEESSTRLL